MLHIRLSLYDADQVSCEILAASDMESDWCIRVVGFSQPKWISVLKSAKLRKSAAEKRDPKKHLSLSVAICDRSTRTEFCDRK